MAFFNQLTKRSLSQSAVMSAAIKNVTVIGSGLMGAGIAQVAAQTGHTVTMVDIDGVAVKKAEQRIGASIQRVAKKKFGDAGGEAEAFIKDALGRLSTSTDAAASVNAADLVIEAIVENLDVKKKLFAELDAAAPQHTIFASNTSSLPIGKIAEATNRKDRFGGLHFFNPVPVMKLLEVVRTPYTSQDTFDKMWAWGEKIGKITVKAKDTPGFILNYLLLPYLMEAIKMVERGDASVQDIDTTMKLGAGYPMGPFELCDSIGLDVMNMSLEGYNKENPKEEKFRQPELLVKMVKEGKHGIKSGEGFYKRK